jgi:peptidoglycan-N-acetylglucosamine deacetylase
VNLSRALSSGLAFFISFGAFSVEVSFSMDDPEVTDSPIYSTGERNDKILQAFENHRIKGALFVCGMRVDNPQGKTLLQTWDSKGHLIANHSYSHLYFHSKKLSFENYRDDFLKVESLISSLSNFTKLYRFPFLKEGDTQDKRDNMRRVLNENGYGQGYVTIDASDWYVDSRLRDRLNSNPKADLTPYRDFYLKHMWSRAVFYNDLSKKVFGKEIKHTVLIHHNLLNALFLDDLMNMFKQKGWKLISAKDAFKDNVFKLAPKILPAGESIVWAAAKETGKYEDTLRYPGEDGEYEKDEMDQLGL